MKKVLRKHAENPFGSAGAKLLKANAGRGRCKFTPLSIYDQDRKNDKPNTLQGTRR